MACQGGYRTCNLIEIKQCVGCGQYRCESCREETPDCPVCGNFRCADCTLHQCAVCEKGVCIDCTEVCWQSDSDLVCHNCCRRCSECDDLECGCDLGQCQTCSKLFCRTCRQVHFNAHCHQVLLTLVWTNCSSVVLTSVQHALFHELDDECERGSH